jgi:hydrogenase expression/formation protein HypE
MTDRITLAHGSGGLLTHTLIRDIFLKHMSNDILLQGDDSARLPFPEGRLAFTTDSFVVSPIFFKGGDIGKLAICGTVNDLSCSGAKPLYLSCGFILEEGMPFGELEQIAASMGRTAAACGVRIVAGDTKVVPRGAADRIFINTSGIGVIPQGIEISGANARPGDRVIATGPLGDHGCSILLERENLGLAVEIQSDCAHLNNLVEKVLSAGEVHVLRDPTRGGAATTLNEIAQQSGVGILVQEDRIPVRDEVRGVCELLGMDPLYMANEGRLLIIAPESSVPAILEILHQEDVGQGACVIGEILEEQKGRVLLRTVAGGSRILDMLVGDQLPRIC